MSYMIQADSDTDALVAAPNHHKLLLENESVRVLETRIEPGDTVPMHTHCWSSAVYVISWSDFVRRDETGEVVVDTRVAGLAAEPGSAVWGEPIPLHTLENVGNRLLHVIAVEVKTPARGNP